MLYRDLGATGKQVSQVGLGTWPLAGNGNLAGYGARDAGRAGATIWEAVAAGVNIFDTADVYGDGFAEELLGQTLQKDDDVVVVTKGGLVPSAGSFDPDPEALTRRAEASLKRLRRRTIEVYLLHNPPPHLIGISETYRSLERLRTRGIARWLGISVAQSEHAWLAMDRPEVDVIQLPFNLMNVSADFGLFSEAARRGKAVLVREALGNGFLSDKALAGAAYASDDFRASMPAEIREHVRAAVEVWRPFRKPDESWVDFALRFVLDRPEASSVLVGARHPEQVAAFARAGKVKCAALSQCESPVKAGGSAVSADSVGIGEKA